MDSFFWQTFTVNPFFAISYALLNAFFAWDVLDLLLLSLIITLVAWPFSVVAVRARRSLLKNSEGLSAYIASLGIACAMIAGFLALVPAAQGGWVAADKLGQTVLAGFLLGLVLKKPAESFRERMRRIMKVPEELELFVILITFNTIVLLAGACALWLAVHLGV